MSYILLDRKWGQPVYGTASGTVTWEVASYSGLSFDTARYSLADFESAIINAFQTWESVADIDFELAHVSGTADISFTMAPLLGSTIGRATSDFYVLPGTDQMASAGIELDSLEYWSPYGQTALNFYAVAVHEIGHALGLDHVSDPSQIMNPIISTTGLGTGDISGVQFIYGARPIEDQYDVLVGRPGDDRLFGLGGNDTLMGGSGSDLLVGGTGADDIQGDSGDDYLVGESAPARDIYAGQAYRLYTVALGRDPDGLGHDFWTNHLASGAQLTSVAAGFVASPEFQSTYRAMDNATFVEALYHNSLGRAPDSDGFTFWTGVLDSGYTRDAAISGFSESAEYISLSEAMSTAFTTAARQRDFSDDVFRLYDGLLDRVPDAGGMISWTEGLVSGVDSFDIVSGFLSSFEYQSQFGGLVNYEFVARLYQTALDRIGSASEIDAWATEIARGTPRAQVAQAIVESAEARAKSLAKVDAYFRSETSEVLNDTLDGGAGDDLLVGGLGADTFIFDATSTGADVVADLDPWDVIQMDGYAFSELSEVPELLRQDGENVIFESGDQTITFLDTLLTDFA